MHYIIPLAQLVTPLYMCAHNNRYINNIITVSQKKKTYLNSIT